MTSNQENAKRKMLQAANDGATDDQIAQIGADLARTEGLSAANEVFEAVVGEVVLSRMGVNLIV